jgi:hypothetical protein
VNAPIRLMPGRNHVLATAAIGLAMLAAWPWLAPVSYAVPGSSGPAQSAAPAIAGLPGFATFSAVVERPLFSPSRRAAPFEPAPAAGVGIASRYRLIGVVTAGAVRYAWLSDGKRSFQLGEGDPLDGWTVQRIEQDRLVLTAPAGEAVLSLRRAAEENAGNPAAAGNAPR